ncbi:MAG TPA: protein kinase [Thermoanaerobaculia bacterium]|nr:protein kinase [Thermoanaerobaculia bacterium]
MPVTGTLIEGKYEILAKIKEGGMGTIYKVRHRLLDEVRVVKVMRPQIGADEELKRRFTQEAKTATRLKHPNIGAILDFALDSDGMAYIVMEYIDGVNLTELLHASGPPGLPLTLEIAHQSLLALGFLHRKNVVHRDVAPDNLMLTRNEEGGAQIKLIDLGIAKPLDKTIEMTSTGVFLGKLKYSSPEQLGGLEAGETLDGRSDVYSLGVVMYELLTGQLPFSGESPRELFAAHLFKDPIPFPVTDPGGRVPEPVRAAVLKAIEKQRARRYQSAEEFDREIIALKHKLGLAQDPDATHRLLASVRESHDVGLASITPSAQDRLDRHFLAQGTPTPASAPPTTSLSSPGRTVGEWEETVAAAIPEAPRRRRRPPVAAFVLGGAGLVIAGVLVVNRGASSPAQRDVSPPLEAPRTTAAPVAIVPPTAGTDASPVPPPTVFAAQEPTAPPRAEEPSREVSDRLRRAADGARSETRTARGAAERARAPEVAPALFDSARRKEKEGQRLLGADRYASALAAFESAAALFRQAESWSRMAPVRPAERVASIPPTREPAPSEPVKPAPSEPVKPAPTAAPVVVEPRPVPVKPSEVQKVRSEEEKVRDAIAQYVEAQNSLDVGLYARIYPALSGERRRMVEQAFGNLKSQTLELDIQRISVSGSHAEIVGFERRLAVPRIGSEQRDARERTIRLEKRGDAWVITELR